MTIKVQFLGTSGSVPTEKRSLPAVYLEFRGSRVLFDCGEGTQRQMRIAGIPFMKLDRIFISHYHADHCLGLGGLIQTMDLFKRTEKLEIYGPKGVKDVLENIVTAGNFVPEGFDVEINVFKPKGVQQIYADRDYSIRCALLDHTISCLGFSFEEATKRKFLKQKALHLGVPEGPLFHRLQLGEEVKVGKRVIKPNQVLGKAVPGRKVTYIPDTRPCTAAVELARGSNLLIHDSTFSHDFQESAMEGRHSTSKEAAEIAKRAKVKQLYLTHFSQRYTSTSGMETEAAKVFPASKAASDFDIIEI